MSIRQRLALQFETPCNGPGADGIDALGSQAVAAEAAGVDILWLMDPQASGLALHAAVAVASHTREVRIGAEICLAGPHPIHPIRLAEDAASADGIAAGRLELCLRLDRDADSGALEETLAILRGAWSPGPVGPHGRGNRLTEVEIHPKPARSDGPPLWIREPNEVDGTRGIAGAGPAWPLRSAQSELGYIASSPAAAEIYLREWLALGHCRKRARVGVHLRPTSGESEGSSAAPSRRSAEGISRELAANRSAFTGSACERRRAELHALALELGGFGTVDGILLHSLGQSAL